MINRLLLQTVACIVALITSVAATAAGTSPNIANQEPKTATAKEYDFRGAKLGMSLENFRTLPYPDAGAHPHVRAFCTGDAKTHDVIFYNLHSDANEKQMGVTKCAYYEPDHYLAGSWDPAGIAIGTSGYASYDTLYNFAIDPADGISKLYLITLTTNNAAAMSAMNGLMEKFGKPISIKNDKIQNMMGAQLGHTVAIWANPASVIILESPWSQMDKMLITYSESRLAADVLKKKSAISGSDASKM